MNKAVLLGLILLIIILAVAASSVSDNLATAAQAQAAIESGKAARTLSIGMTIAVVFLVTLNFVMMGMIAYLLFIRSNDKRSVGAGKWVSGPNARWGQIGNPKMGSLPGSEYPKMGSGDQVQQLVNIEILRMLKGMHEVEKTALPAAYEKDESEIQW